MRRTIRSIGLNVKTQVRSRRGSGRDGQPKGGDRHTGAGEEVADRRVSPAVAYFACVKTGWQGHGDDIRGQAGVGPDARGFAVA